MSALPETDLPALKTRVTEPQVVAEQMANVRPALTEA